MALRSRQGEAGGAWSLLIRRTPRTGELAYYCCYSPEPMSLTRLVAVARRRWAIEESFQAAKGLARPRFAPSARLDPLAALIAAGDVHPRAARGHHRHRALCRPAIARADRHHLRRGAPTADAGPEPAHRHRRSADLVALAKNRPAPRQSQPLRRPRPTNPRMIERSTVAALVVLR